MCLGIVGRIVSIDAERADLADVDVAGLVRKISIGILVDEGLVAGDWILIHSGFAMEKIDAATAHAQTAALRDYTGGPPADGEDDVDDADDGAEESPPPRRRAAGSGA